MKLTKIEIEVLNKCEHPMTVEFLSELLKMHKNDVKEILESLKSKNLVVCKEIGHWERTLEGDKEHFKGLKKSKLTDDELRVLKQCCEEPRTAEGMYEAVGLTKEKLLMVLNKLKDKGLIYRDEDGIWCSTLEGDKAFYKKR